MDINRAKKLAVGDVVYCPEDRGNKSFRAIVKHVGTDVYKNIYGNEYLWVTVRELGSVNNSGGVWPSNRISV